MLNRCMGSTSFSLKYLDTTNSNIVDFKQWAYWLGTPTHNILIKLYIFQVLINNGFTPEWITMAKEIDQDIDNLKQEIRSDRMPLGPYPLTEDDVTKWKRICESNGELAKSINNKINTYNLIVPLLNKQKLHVAFDKICEDILKNGVHSVVKIENENMSPMKTDDVVRNDSEDLFGLLFKALGDLLTFKGNKKV